MFIKSFSIDGFGLFHEFSQDNLPENLVLFYGENEAGKTTLLSFLRAMFFGFTKSNHDSNRYPPLRGGNHAGTLSLSLADNTEWYLNRAFGSGTKRSFEIGAADGRHRDEHDLTNLFGGASKEMYRNVYAFSLKELQSLSLFQSEQVKAALYGATIGSGLKSLGQAEKDFDTRLTQLFGPQARERDINVKLQEISALRERLQELVGSTAQYSKLQEQIADLDKQLRSKEADHKKMDERIRQIERTLKQDSDSPAYAATQGAGSNVQPREFTPQQSVHVETVFNFLTGAREQFTTLSELKQQIDERDAKLATGFSEVGGTWDVSRLEQVCASAPKPQQVLVFEQKFTALEADRVHCERSLEVAHNELKLREEEQTNIEAELERLDADASEEATPEQLDRLKSGSEKFSSDARELATMQENIAQLSQRLLASQDFMKDLLGSEDVSAGLLDLCDPELLDSTQAALTIANLVNRSAIMINKDELVSIDATVRSAEDAIEAATEKLEEGRRTVESLTKEAHNIPIHTCAPPDVIDAAAADKGRVSQLFDQIESGMAELHQLNYELEDLQDLLECSASAETLSRLDLAGIKQAGESYNREADSINAQVQTLTTQVDTTKVEIIGKGAKHQLLLTQLREYDGLDVDPRSVEEQIAAVQELRPALTRAREVHAKQESLTSRINDKQRSKEALESTAAESYAKRTKIIAICVAVLGLGFTTYLIMFQNAFYGGIAAFCLFAVGVLFLWRSADHATPEESAETFAKEITTLEAELRPLQDEQKQLNATINKCLKVLSLSAAPPVEKCDTIEDNLKADSQNLSRKQELQREVADTEQEITRLGNEQLLKENELASLQTSLSDTKHAWHINLQSTGVQIDATPEEVLPELSRLLEKGKEVVKREKAFENDQQTLKKITEFLVQCGVTPPQTEYKESWLKATDEWLKANAAARDKQSKLAALEEKLAEAQKQFEILQQELVECQSKGAAAIASQKQVRMSWQLWLIAAGLPTTLACDTALSLADTISDIDELRSDLRAQSKMAVNFSQSVDQYRTLAAGISSIGERAFEACADELIDLTTVAFEHAEERRAREGKRSIVRERHSRLLEVIAELKNRRGALQRALESFLQDINHLRNEWRTWLLDHSLDAELKPETVSHILPSLTALLSVAVERSQLREKQTAAEQEIGIFADKCRALLAELQLGDVNLADGFSTVAEVTCLLRDQLQREADAVALEVGGLGGDETGEHLGLRHQIASLIAQRERLTQSKELQETKQEMERLQKQLEDMSYEWSRYAIAQHLLTLSKQRFEREGQPRVVEIAGNLFKTMTNSTYTKVYPSKETPGEFLVENVKHKAIATDYLSTGTQEQLYLSLRFGFIKHRATQTEALPVIMDDILVNFDDRRTATAAQVITELAASHQVLYFTCHPMTVAMFKALKPDVKLVSLSSSATAEAAIQRLMEKFNDTLTKPGQRQPAD